MGYHVKVDVDFDLFAVIEAFKHQVPYILADYNNRGHLVVH